MSNETTTESTSSFIMLRAMVGIGIICGLLIVLSYEGTLPRVQRLRAEALEKAIFEVVPGIEKTNPFLWDNDKFIPAPEGSSPTIFAGYDANNQFIGVAIEASGQGYADIIRVLYGYVTEKQQVVGFYVLESKETPGLGDKIQKDINFLNNFSSLDVSLTENLDSLRNTVVTVKNGAKKNDWEIDGITGATISSRAIGSILGESTSIWISRIYQHKEDFNLSNP
ncbi:MAG: FMN-binding protein [Bacteroidota bacterium]